MSAPSIWREKDGCYSLSGIYWDGYKRGDCRIVQHIFLSQDLKRWTYIGSFIENDIFTAPGEDGACPYFWPIGAKQIVVFASYQRGSQYLLGDYDKVRHRLKPICSWPIQFPGMEYGGVHAPSAMPDGKGGLYVIYNINAAKKLKAGIISCLWPVY